MGLNTELLPLYEAVAFKLSGCKVSVQMKAPPVEEAKASASRDKDRHYIQIDPSLSTFDTVWFFLHELSHIKQHPLAISSYHTRPSRSEPCPAPNTEHESQADKLAEQWFDFAAIRQKPWIDWEYGMLLTLKQSVEKGYF